MAKTRPESSKKRRPKHHHGSQQQPRSAAHVRSRPQPPSKAPAELVNEALAAMTQGDIQTGRTAAQKALAAVEPVGGGNKNKVNKVVGNVGTAAVCSLLGEIYLEGGEVDEARAVLERAAELDPDGSLADNLGGGIDKFLNLAQLSELGGKDSVRWYERGAAALRKRIARGESGGHAQDEDDEDDEDDEATENKHKLAQVLCAVAEIWMTDLSYEPECEAQCEALTTEATLVAPDLPEAWQTLANMRISQDRAPDARAALERSIALWDDLPPEHPDVPAFPARVALVRLLLTVGWLERAADMSARLLRDDDEAVEVWYLAGYTHYLQGEQLRSGGKQVRWQACWREARRCLARCLKLFKQQDYEDDRLGEHAAELLAEAVEAVGPVPEEEEEGEDEDDEEDVWEDEEDGDDDDDDSDEEEGSDKEMG